MSLEFIFMNNLGTLCICNFKIPKMTNKEFAQQLEKRTVRFAIDIINLSSSMPSTTES